MKVKNIIALMIIVGVSVFVGCEKEAVNESKSTIENTKTDVRRVDMRMVYFDELGLMHNAVLDFIGNNIDAFEATQEERFDLASDYLEDYSTTFEEFLEKSLVVDEILNNPSQTASLLFANVEATCELCEYYNRLGGIFVECLQMTDDSIEVTPEEFDEMILVIESEIYENYTVEIDFDNNTGNEASLFLGTCAIARHSYQYWYDAAQDESNPWNQFLCRKKKDGEERTFWQKLWRGTKIVAFDAAGFLMGGLNIVGTYKDGKIVDPKVGLNGASGVKLASQWSGSVE